jgi:hypothetical protein
MEVGHRQWHCVSDNEGQTKQGQTKQRALVWISPCPHYLCYMSFSGTPLGQGRRLDHSSFLGKQPSNSAHPPTSYEFRSVFLFRVHLLVVDFLLVRPLLARDPPQNLHPPHATPTTKKTNLLLSVLPVLNSANPQKPSHLVQVVPRS